MTGIVFAFVAVMGLFMWVLDKGIEWITLRPAAGLEIKRGSNAK